MQLFGRKKLHEDIKEIFLAELISVTGGVIAGTFLFNLIHNIGVLIGLFILYPGLLEMNGNLYASLSARLSNLLILGKMNIRKDKVKFIIRNVTAVSFLTLVVSFTLGLIIYLFSYFFFHANNFIIIPFTVVSSLISAIIQIPLTILVTLWVFKHKFDPENIMGPDITTFSDIITIISLLITAKILLWKWMI